jgi:hypothetical protein
MIVIGIMTALATPSLVSLAVTGNQDFTKEVYDLQGMLSVARTAAMAKNTFVWAGLGQGVVNGRQSLMVVAYASQNGLNDTATQNNLALVMKRQILPGLGMATVSSSLIGLDTTGVDLTHTSIPQNWTLPKQTVAGTVIPVTQVILFSPTGEAFVTSTPLSYIQIGLQPMHGAVADAHNIAALQISGITSQTEVFRN